MTQKKVNKLLSKNEICAQMDELIGKLVARDKTLESLEKSADGFRELISRTEKNIRHPDIFDIHRFKLKQLLSRM
jgi:arsenate reductase-like glutaredoxin family protein